MLSKRQLQTGLQLQQLQTGLQLLLIKASSFSPQSLLVVHTFVSPSPTLQRELCEPLPRLLPRAAAALAGRPEGLREGAALGPAVAGTLPGCEGQEEGTHTGFHLRPRGARTWVPATLEPEAAVEDLMTFVLMDHDIERN